MSTGSERLVRRLGTLADSCQKREKERNEQRQYRGLMEWRRTAKGRTSKSIVDLLNRLAIIELSRLSSEPILVGPTAWHPRLGVLPEHWVHLGDTGAGHDEVTLGNDVRAGLGGGREGLRNGNVADDFAHDGVDGGVDSEGLADAGVEDGELKGGRRMKVEKESDGGRR
jgi:hypothetical protein